MKLIIAGSRSLNPTNDQIKECLDSFGVDIKEIECIVSGGAKGVDTCAIDFAKENNIPVILFLPEYEKFGKRAPLVRNKQMAVYGDYLILFHDGKSTGSMHMLRQMKDLDKFVCIVNCGNCCVLF